MAELALADATAARDVWLAVAVALGVVVKRLRAPVP